MVATSEISVSLTIDDARHLDSLVVDLSQLGDVSVERNRGIVALVGAGLAASGEAMSRALAALGGTRVHMLSLSASGIEGCASGSGRRIPFGRQVVPDE